MTKAELLERIRTGRSQFEAALSKITVDQIILYDSWTVKDLLGHVGFWEQRAHFLLSTLQRGETPPGIPPGETLDDVNERVYHEHHDQPLEEVRRWEQAAYEDLLTLVEAAPDDDLFRPDRFAWTEGTPFVEWIAGNTYDHYEEHLESLQ